MNNDGYDSNLVNQFLKYDYHDRGMMKWQGFYLSDHTAVVAKTATANQQARSQQHGPTMTEAEIAALINEAVVKGYPVMVDKAERTVEGLIPHQIVGPISGWFGSQIIINNQAVAIDAIYSIQKA